MLAFYQLASHVRVGAASHTQTQLYNLNHLTLALLARSHELKQFNLA